MLNNFFLHLAKTNKFDVVLIDTAGRMQDNEPLMRALAKVFKFNDLDCNIPLCGLFL